MGSVRAETALHWGSEEPSSPYFEALVHGPSRDTGRRLRNRRG